MIEIMTTNIIRCDLCNCLLEEGDDFTHIFYSDLCNECVGSFLQKIESERIISKEVFDELIDDIKHKI